MRRHLVAVVTGMIIAATAACSGGGNHEATPSTPPAFTPSEGAASSQDPNQRIVDVINPCALVTPQDLRDITGKDYFPMGMTPAADQTAYEHSCHYGNPTPALRVTTLLDTKKDGPVWKNFVKNHGLTQKANDIGDEAFRGNNVLLATRGGRAIVSFELATSSSQRPANDQLATLARRALDRIASST